MAAGTCAGLAFLTVLRRVNHVANPEHLAKLMEGIGQWNKWRKQHPKVEPDLAKSDLHEADLTNADLSEADLSSADLSDADLSGADLREAIISTTNLRAADLADANMSEADLRGAHLCKADLFRADVSGANLNRADLSEAILQNTNLTSAYLEEAILCGADLRGANLSKAQLGYSNLSGAFLYKANLNGTILSNANLSWAILSGADLTGANLRGANLYETKFRLALLCKADLSGTDLSKANLSKSKLNRASFCRAHLSGADLSGADLCEADLTEATLVNTDLRRANLTACSVHGISAWNLRLEGAIQSNLIITPRDESAIQVDSLEVAQFVYLLLNNNKIRHVIDTITSKMVLILGRFTAERKVILDAIRDQLRKRDYLPVLFDFEKPASKDLTGTITTLANMARFIIADLSNPSSVAYELAMVVPGTVVPVQAIISQGQQEFAMFVDLRRRYHWVLEPYEYQSKELLIRHLRDCIIDPAEAKAK